MTYDKMLASFDDVVKVKEADFNKVDYLKGFKGLYKNGKIVIDSNIKSDKEKVCVLSEELGHHYTSHGNILDINDVRNIKQEKRARNWGYERLVGIVGLINAFNAGVKGRFELAEYFGVTEEFLEEAIQHYREKYGQYYELDNYIVYFEPLGVLKMF